KGLILDLPQVSPGEVDMPKLPSLEDGGFTIDFWAAFENLEAGQIILDNRKDGKGLAVTTAKNGTVRIDFSDGANSGGWDSDPGMIEHGKRHQISIIVDGGPNIVTFVIDGVVCDGGTHRQFGWGRFDPAIENINGDSKAKIASRINGTLETLRVYDRYLLNSEAIANYRAASK
ncbi:MAG: LamG-like jellyroll fold domain-containing protein, partial [Candidatus Hydrogenedentes bacterium]|nr:LamG-like jellyroll fold domain-containing protein [Candidatus Hydrogenedentota bacterium]